MKDYTQYRQQPQGSVAAVIEVTGSATQGETTYLIGTNLETKEQVQLYLEDGGNNADRYKNRPSLEKMLKGYKVATGEVHLEPGNIILAEHVRKNGDKHSSGWVRILAKSKEELPQRTVRGLLHLRAGVSREGKAYGYCLEFSQNVNTYVNADQPEGLRDGIVALLPSLSKNSKPTFLLRCYREADGSKQVYGSAMLSNTWNADEKREMTPDEVASKVMSIAHIMQQEHADAKFSVIPAKNYPLSSFVVKDQNKMDRLIELSRRFYQDKDGRPMVRSSLAQGSVGEESKIMFLGNAYPMNTGTNAMDPILLNEFVSFNEVDTKQSDTPSHSGQREQPGQREQSSQEPPAYMNEEPPLEDHPFDAFSEGPGL